MPNMKRIAFYENELRPPAFPSMVDPEISRDSRSGTASRIPGLRENKIVDCIPLLAGSAVTTLVPVIAVISADGKEVKPSPRGLLRSVVGKRYVG